MNDALAPLEPLVGATVATPPRPSIWVAIAETPWFVPAAATTLAIRRGYLRGDKQDDIFLAASVTALVSFLGWNAVLRHLQSTPTS